MWAKPKLTPCGGGGEDEGRREEEEEMGRTMRGYWGAFVRSMGRSPNKVVGGWKKGGGRGRGRDRDDENGKKEDEGPGNRTKGRAGQAAVES